jgi:pimeloyl-ACP methyl ester carboxylesterase
MSLGGLAGLLTAARPDIELAGTVIVDIGPRPRVEGVQPILDFTSEHELESVDAFVQRAMAFNPHRRPELLRRSLLHNLRQLPSGRWAWKWDPRRAKPSRADDVLVRQERLWSSVAQIRCPALVLRGGRSTVFLDEDAAELAEALSDARVAIVPDAGHTVQGDNPRGLLDAMAPFLAQIHGPVVTGC